MQPPLPMSPILKEEIPLGEDWGYQIKWDGVRLLSHIIEDQIELFSKELKPKTKLYPEIITALSDHCSSEEIWLDGEAILFDINQQRPDFQKILQREKSRVARPFPGYSVIYVLFDLLYVDGVDIRDKSFAERFKRLQQLFPKQNPNLFVTDVFDHGQQLWEWVSERGWEGIVSKRLSSPYQPGKKHNNWLKKKRKLLFDVEIVGVWIKHNTPSSLVMSYENRYFGRVAIGLTVENKRRISFRLNGHLSAIQAWSPLPPDLQKLHIEWFDSPIHCQVSGLEVTSAGVLRHPQIVKLKLELDH